MSYSRSHRPYGALLSALLAIAFPLAAAAAPPGLAEVTRIHCPGFVQQLAAYERQFASRMSRWSQAELSDVAGRDVLYLFSGPDVACANARAWWSWARSGLSRENHETLHASIAAHD